MPAKVERCVKGLLPKMMEEYEKKHGKPPSEKRRKEIESDVWAICNGKFGTEGGDADAEIET